MRHDRCSFSHMFIVTVIINRKILILINKENLSEFLSAVAFSWVFCHLSLVASTYYTGTSSWPFESQCQFAKENLT